MAASKPKAGGRAANRRAGPADLEGIRARIDDVDAQIHTLINVAARNKVLTQTWANVNARLQAPRFRSNFDDAKWKRAVKEHDRMVELLSARDAAGLRALMVTHLLHKRDAVIELMRAAAAPRKARKAQA